MATSAGASGATTGILCPCGQVGVGRLWLSGPPGHGTPVALTDGMRQFLPPLVDDDRPRHPVECERCAAAESISLLVTRLVAYWHCPQCGHVWIAREGSQLEEVAS
jgi:predicted RNA-binding Zn-ribbon protein involved in translation (DUF1610 family)